LVVTLTALVLAVEMIGLFVLGVRHVVGEHRHHAPNPHPAKA
jgi:hypothetical protein